MAVQAGVWSMLPLFHGTLGLALGILVQLVGSFVMLFFAFGEADFELDSSANEMQVKWNQCITCALYLANEFADFLGVKQ